MPEGCLVDSNKRSSRFTGAHWRTLSSEASARSEDPQSPQPIRGYTGGLELLVGGAKYSSETRPTTCSPADGRLNGQLHRTRRNTKLSIRWSLECGSKCRVWGPTGGLLKAPTSATDKSNSNFLQQKQRREAEDNFSQICPCAPLCCRGQLDVTSPILLHKSSNRRILAIIIVCEICWRRAVIRQGVATPVPEQASSL